MMKEEAIVKSLFISRIGERQHFQVILPRDTKKIIGLEYGTTEKNGEPLPSPTLAIDSDTLKLFANRKIGSLTLKAAGCEGIFFQDNLVDDNNAHFGENITSVIWQAEKWAHGTKRHEMEFCITENSIVYGFFHDSWGVGQFQTLNYKLNLYLWIEKCIE